MAGFEHGSSGIGSDRSANCAEPQRDCYIRQSTYSRFARINFESLQRRYKRGHKQVTVTIRVRVSQVPI